MLHKTKAIVLNHLKYGDNSLITTLYTATHGRKTFLIQGFYSRKSKFHATFFQPLTLLNLEIDINPKRELQRIKEIGFAHPFQTVPFDTVKRAITLFLAEILYKTLKEEEPNPSLFEYVYHTLQLLDVKEDGVANFHLLFLMHLTKHLGFYPIDNYSETNCVFDTVNGRFYQFISAQSKASDQTKSLMIHQLLSLSFDQLETLQLNHQTRNSLLQLIIEFYQVHLGSLTEVKSLPVLQSVFEE
jgi:DNA repair protein RecO (recombination protein O)